MQGTQWFMAQTESYGCAQVRERVTAEQDDNELVHLEDVPQSAALGISTVLCGRGLRDLASLCLVLFRRTLRSRRHSDI